MVELTVAGGVVAVVSGAEQVGTVYFMKTWIMVYGWSMAFIVPTAQGVLLVAAFVAMRNRLFRWEFGFLALAWAFSLVASCIYLFIRLSREFDVFGVEVGVRRFLVVLADCVYVISIPFYMMGFLMLVRTILALPQEKPLPPRE